MSRGSGLSSPATVLTAVLDGLHLGSTQQRVLRVLAGVTVLLHPALVPAAGGAWHPVATVLLVLVGLLAVLLPDSNAPLAWLLLAAAFWMAVVPETLSAWTLLTALDLLAFHLLVLLCAYAPAPLALDGALLRLWVGRAAVLAAVTALVWVAARLVGGLDPAASGLALGGALALLTGWAAYLLPRLTARDGS